MKAPTVHLNGTSFTSLLDAAKDALAGVTDAHERLRPVYPNGRDYYCQDRDAHAGTAQRLAADDWMAMDLKLRQVMQELATLVEDIEAQRGK